MTLNTMLQERVRNGAKDLGEPLALNELIEDLTEEELNTLEAMLKLFLDYSSDCWNNRLGKEDSELFSLRGTASRLSGLDEDLDLQPMDVLPDHIDGRKQA